MRRVSILGVLLIALAACDRAPAPVATSELPDTPSPLFRNVAAPTAYVGDASCAGCHASETAAYRQHAMSRTFRPWTLAQRTEPVLSSPLHHARSGFDYSVVDSGGARIHPEYLPNFSAIAEPRTSSTRQP